jgi:hypothetical protein
LRCAWWFIVALAGVEHLAKKETSPPRPSPKKSLLPNTAAEALVPGKFPAAFSPPPTPPRSVIVADYVMKQRARTRALYEGFLASVSLNKDDEEKVLDLLGRAEKAMFEETEEALQQERFPVAPSASEIRQRQGETDGELQSLLGYEDFNRLRDYQASIPNQIVIDAMKEAGASLSDQQVRSTLAIMREERTLVMESARLRNLDGVDPEVIRQMIQSDQQQIHFATENRLAPLLSSEQLAIFKKVINGLETAKSKP